MDTAQCSAILDLELKWHWLSWDCGLRVATQWQRHQRHYSARSNQAYALMATTSGCPLSTHPPLCFSSPFEPFLLAHLHGSLIVHAWPLRRWPSDCRSFNTSTAAECCAACTNTSLCTYFTFVHSRQLCWVKADGTGGTSDDKDCTSGSALRRAAQQPLLPEPNRPRSCRL